MTNIVFDSSRTPASFEVTSTNLTQAYSAHYKLNEIDATKKPLLGACFDLFF